MLSGASTNEALSSSQNARFSRIELRRHVIVVDALFFGAITVGCQLKQNGERVIGLVEVVCIILKILLPRLLLMALALLSHENMAQAVRFTSLVLSGSTARHCLAKALTP